MGSNDRPAPPTARPAPLKRVIRGMFGVATVEERPWPFNLRGRWRLRFEPHGHWPGARRHTSRHRGQSEAVFLAEYLTGSPGQSV